MVRFFEESEDPETTCIKALKKKRKKWDTQNGGLHFIFISKRYLGKVSLREV